MGISNSPIAKEVKKSDETRRRIIDAAAEQFAHRGYAHTRLSDIAKAAKSHTGGIYYYFASRDELVSIVLKISTERAISLLRRALNSLPEDASTQDKMEAAITAQLMGVVSGDPYNLAHNRLFPQVSEEIRLKHRPLLREYFSIWRNLIAQGQKNGEIDPDIDPAILRLTISGSIQWAAEWANIDHGSPEQLGKKMARIFLQGILQKPQI